MSDRNNKILLNESLIRSIVRAIEKGNGPDITDYLSERRKKTNNALLQMPGDNINTNLEEMVTDGIKYELLSFNRTVWAGCILLDKENHITYNITSHTNLTSIPRKKGRTIPHYLHSLLFVENGKCKANCSQITLEDFYGIVLFDTQELTDDFNKISDGRIDLNEDYRHYVVAYTARQREIEDIELLFLDKNFNTIDVQSLMAYIKPDFSKLTNPEPVQEEKTAEHSGNAKRLVAVKAGIKPKLREEEHRSDKN